MTLEQQVDKWKDHTTERLEELFYELSNDINKGDNPNFIIKWQRSIRASVKKEIVRRRLNSQ